jgi:hypothetical protein
VPELKQIVASTWPGVSEWLLDLPQIEPETPAENWPAELIAQADRNNGSPIADVSVQLVVLPVAGGKHWVLTEDPRRHLLHALVSSDLLLDAERHFDWLLTSLRRIG